jgi:hypothetical protein
LVRARVRDTVTLKVTDDDDDDDDDDNNNGDDTLYL